MPPPLDLPPDHVRQVPLHISLLRPGGVAAASGLLRCGDHLVAVDGVAVDAAKEAADLIKSADGAVTLTVRRAPPGE